MKRAAVLIAALVIAGCGNQADTSEKISEETGVPLCSDVLAGDVPLPESGKCVDGEP